MRILLSLSKEKALPGLSLVFLKEIVALTCREAFPKVFGKSMVVHLAVASVSDRSIATLNKNYRGKGKPTDILSFGEFEKPTEVTRFRGNELDLGELILAPDVIRRNAEEDGVSWKHEFVFVFSHGILHLLGYDHGEKMFALQDLVTEQLMHKALPKRKIKKL